MPDSPRARTRPLDALERAGAGLDSRRLDVFAQTPDRDDPASHEEADELEELAFRLPTPTEHWIQTVWEDELDAAS